MPKKLWKLATGSSGGDNHYLFVIANSKADVGQYIRDNVKNVLFLFEGLYFCVDVHGKIYDELLDWYENDDFLEKIDTLAERECFIIDIELVLEKMSGEENVNELHGIDYGDSDRPYVSINSVSTKKLVDLTSY